MTTWDSTSTDGIALAVIGGPGLYQLDWIDVVQRQSVETPYGQPSSPLVFGRLGDVQIVFLARHGEHHQLAPHQVNYRANLWALHQVGAQQVLGINSVGGIRADLGPGVLAVPEQIIDYTWGRSTSFGKDAEGVLHVDFTDPYSSALRSRLFAAAGQVGVDLAEGGCYGATQGPRLETRAEIARLRRDGCDLVGMTGMPEAALARELGLDYACLAIVANWAAGCDPEHREITFAEVQSIVVEASAGIPGLLEALLRN